MTVKLRIILALMISMLWLNPAWAKPKVAVSILPVYDLVAQLGEGVFTPILLLDPNLSPHDAALKPSQIRDLAGSDVVFWISPTLESNLAKILTNLDQANTKVVPLIDAPGLTLLPFRSALIDGADDTAHDEHHHDSHNHAHHDGDDPHIWLSYANSRQMVMHMAKVLSEVDVDNASVYAQNRDTLLSKMAAHHSEIQSIVKQVASRGFLVLHDSQQYFDHEYGLNMLAVLVQHSLHELGAKGMAQAKQLSQSKQAVCLFAQPQFASERALTNLAANLQVNMAITDHIGSSLADYEDAWFKVTRNLAEAMADCLRE